MRIGALVYLYRRRLRVHGVQELLAGAGVAASVALVFATLIASASVAGSSARLVHTVVGRATLQLRARGQDGFSESLLARVENMPGVAQAAPLLEQTATLQAPGGRRLTVDLAGADTALTALDGVAHNLPRRTLAPGSIGLSEATAHSLGLYTRARGTPNRITLLLRGTATPLTVSAILGPKTFGALSGADVAVMQLSDLQSLSGLRHRIGRILIQTQPGRNASVRGELAKLAGDRAEVADADQDVALLRQALKPSDQASALFAAISVLLGVLFAAGALLLTVPERRRAIAELRIVGTRRSAIAQMLLFQALCLGTVASLAGLAVGYGLARGVLHQSNGYLREAFTLGTQTLVTLPPLGIALGAGIAASCLASAVPLADLRGKRALDAAYRSDPGDGAALSRRAARGLALAAVIPLAAASILFWAGPEHALAACELLALATVLCVPLAFALVLRAGHELAERRQRMTVLPVALSSLRDTKLRSLALAGTGALALFGGIALGGARADLERGVRDFAHTYASGADIWVGTPGDNQATVDFREGGQAQPTSASTAPGSPPPTHAGRTRSPSPATLAARIAAIPGVASVAPFQGGFVQLGGRRVWLLGRPAATARALLAGQIVGGTLKGTSSPRGIAQRLGEGGWVTVSEQLARAEHVTVGATLTLPTPSGPANMRVAATTSNLAWSPGAIVLSTRDYGRLWHTNAPTALAVKLARGANKAATQHAIEATLAGSGLQAIAASARERSIDALTGEGLSRLGEISTLLLIAATLALAAALSSAIWQRRVALANLRLAGVRPARVRRILLMEATLMLGAGCATGALAGLYGQAIIDAYLTQVSGFPVAGLATSPRPLAILALVIVAVLALVALPAWLASRVSPTLALNE